MDYRDWVIEQVEKLDDYDLVKEYNKYASNCVYGEKVYSMSSFNEMYDGMKPAEIAEMASTWAFNINDDWFTDINGHIQSDCDARFIIDDCLNAFEDFIDDICENPYAYSEILGGDDDYRKEVVLHSAFDDDENAYKEFSAWFEDEYGKDACMYEFDIDGLLSDFREQTDCKE